MRPLFADRGANAVETSPVLGEELDDADAEADDEDEDADEDEAGGAGGADDDREVDGAADGDVDGTVAGAGAELSAFDDVSPYTIVENDSNNGTTPIIRLMICYNLSFSTTKLDVVTMNINSQSPNIIKDSEERQKE